MNTSQRHLLSQSAVITLLLIVCMTGYGIRVRDLVMPASSGSREGSDPALTPSTAVETVAMPPRDIAALNLFGQVEPPALINPVKFQQVPKTRLDLTLNAVFVDTEPARASAVIAAHNNSDPKRYFIGEILSENTVLYAIHSNHVILKRGGRLEKLVLPRDRPK